MGLQMGQMARQREQQNALMQQRERQIGLQEQQYAAEQQAKQAEGDLTARALRGDAKALDELAAVNFDKWKTLDTRTKEVARTEAETFGNAALDVLQLPPQQRVDRIIGYARSMPQFAEKINELAYLPPAEQDAMLRTIVAEAQMIGKLHEMERPSYQAIPEGGSLVNTRDPSAVQQFQAGAPQPVGLPPLSAIEAELARRGVR